MTLILGGLSVHWPTLPAEHRASTYPLHHHLSVEFIKN